MPPLFFRFRYLRGVCVFRHRSASRGVRHGGEDPGQQRGDHGGAEAVPAGVLRQTLRGGEEEPPARQQRPGQHLLGGGAAERIQPDVAGRFTVRGRFLFFSLSLTVTRGNTQRAAEPLGYLSNNGIANPPLQETPRFVPRLINRPPLRPISRVHRLIPIHETGWKSFDVTQAVHYWSRSQQKTPMHLEVWVEGERPGSYAAEAAKSVRFTTQEQTDNTLGKPELVLYTLSLEEYG